MDEFPGTCGMPDAKMPNADRRRTNKTAPFKLLTTEQRVALKEKVADSGIFEKLQVVMVYDQELLWTQTPKLTPSPMAERPYNARSRELCG